MRLLIRLARLIVLDVEARACDLARRLVAWEGEVVWRQADALKRWSDSVRLRSERLLKEIQR